MADSASIIQAKELIKSAKNSSFSIEKLKGMSIELAGLLIEEAQKTQSHKDKVLQNQLARMMDDPLGKVFTTSMTDQCFRSHNSSRVANQLSYILKKYGVPKYLSGSKRLGLQTFKWFGTLLPGAFVPLTKQLLRKETSTVILPGEPDKLEMHVKKRRSEGVRINLNHLGEAILGEEEAKHRLQIYLDDLKNPLVDYISVKISTIYSQLDLLSREKTLEILSDRLKQLYRAAQENKYIRPDGKESQKFVNLDMEEYRDLSLTIDLFCRVLSEPEFKGLSAGIVLQSYLPDSFAMQQKITAWARERVAQGNAPIKIRIVKGANLAMERFEASLRGWPQAPYATKSEVDANYKRMVMFGLQTENAKAVRIGVASHNLFDIAFAILLRAQNGVEAYISFEMLEGMADHIRRAVQEITGDILLYCPTATKEEFQNAVAYLIRRLDENTAPENFLRHIFGLRPDTKEWERQTLLFNKAFTLTDTLPYTPRRTQNRQETPAQPDPDSPFDNEPDTDWSLIQNVRWGEQIRDDWKNHKIAPIPLVIGGAPIPPGIDVRKRDRSFIS